MAVELGVLMLAGFVLSALLTRAMRQLALTHGLLDVPNLRSSHAHPTPRGGGLAVVATATGCFAVLAASGRMDGGLTAALAGGLLVAAVGFQDDRRPLPAGVRLAAHLVAALWALAWLGGLPPLAVGKYVVSSGWAGYVFGALGIIWAINLFNFMDGIDGIAASEAMFVAVAAALLSQSLAVGTGVALAALVFAAACGGFLLWNWPPARIFLGDVGSGYLGYVIVVLAVADTRSNPVALWVWLILGGVFFVDATVTLVRRTLRRERVHEAHRSHAYQWLTRSWASHGKVTLAMLALNCLWLLPWAMLAGRLPGHALACVIGAFVPLTVLVISIGSGRVEVGAPDG